MSTQITLRRLTCAALFGLGLALLLGACSQPPTTTPTPTSRPTQVVAPSATIPPGTPTPEPFDRSGRALVVCMGQEPASLYPYSGSSRSRDAILQAIYDGPIDQRGFEPQPVILEKIPGLADGDAVLEPVLVSPGDPVVDADGAPTVLEPGVLVLPSECNQRECAVSYGGEDPIEMDRLVVTFRLRPGLQWSDGAPLTARDSVYSFELASAPETPVSKTTIERTASYEALDERTLRWSALPGYLDAGYAANFWMPLPEHAWGSLGAAELLTAQRSSQAPLGWGPYVIEQWAAGETIRLRWNQAYWRAAEALPRFEHLVFRFVGQVTAENLARLQTGECDLLDTSTDLVATDPELRALADGGQLQAVYAPGGAWDHLVFGIVPRAYDDGWQFGDRPDFFGEAGVRRALTHCLDRQGVIDQLLAGQVLLSDSYLAPGHPLSDPQAEPLAFDPQAAAALLEEAGWLDEDDNPDTPRLYRGEDPEIPQGTPFTIRLWTSEAPQRRQAVEILAGSLASCGVQAEVQVWPADELYASGPEGPLFGRDFDLAQLAWQVGVQPPCQLFLGEAVPGDPTLVDEAGGIRFPYGWGGWNPTGYANPAYDTACQTARAALPGQVAHRQSHLEAQALFAQDLPAVPLFYHLRVAAARPDLCGLQFQAGDSQLLWNLESLDYGEGCLD